MTVSSEALRSLREELSAAASPRQKLRLLARAWRTVRDLSTEQRRALASEIGLEEAEGLLEGLARGRGARAAARVLERLGLPADDEPFDLGGLLEELSSPSGRRRVLERAVGHRRRDKLLEAPLDEEAGGPAASGPVPPRAPAISEHNVITPPVDQGASAPPGPPGPATVPAKPLASPPEEPERAVSPRPVPPPSEQQVPLQAGRLLPERLGGVGPLVFRFRVLRGFLEEATPLADGDCEAVLEAFPDGWARRRALTTLFRAGRPASVDLALSLVGKLARPWHRRWCLSDLIRSRALSPQEQETISRRIEELK